MTPRARDAFGRPLPRGADVPVEPDPAPLPPEETLRVAGELLAQGRAFRAHEVFEAIWKATDGQDRELWRAMAQLAVGITHAQRGNITGSAALLRRAAQNLQPWEGSHPHGIDVTAVRAWAQSAADNPQPAASLLASLPPPLNRPPTGSGSG